MSETSLQVGLLGLGAIGTHYRNGLLKAFTTVHVYDSDSVKVEDAESHGATPAADAAALGEKCDIVVVSLPNPDAVRAALLGSRGLLARARSGSVVVDTSTVDPHTSRDLYKAAQRDGIGYLDAPVSGGEPMEAGMEGARACSMTFMVGGDRETYEKAQPIFEALGRYSHHLGPAGSGTIVKLISNLCSGIYMHVAAEAFALGRACGFGPEQLMDVFEHTDAKTYMMMNYIAPRLKNSDVAPGFTVELQLKDHWLVGQLAHELGVPLPINALAIQAWEQMNAAARSGNDITDVVYFTAERAGEAIGPGGR